MVEPPFFSSQSSEYERHQILQEQENEHSLLLSQRQKKPPTVTPKRFKKFFTPRATHTSRGSRQSKTGRQLRDITKTGANRRRHAQPLRDPDWDDIENVEARQLKRRKQSLEIASSPLRSSPLKHMQTADDIRVFEDVLASPTFSIEEALSDLLEHVETFPRPIRRARDAGHNQRILQRSFGGFSASSRGRRRHDHCADWRFGTSTFVSTSSDVHRFNGTALPFCTATCNTNSLIAIGEEEGGVRLIDTARSANFSTSHVAFRPHHNAIMDITFSSNDYMLATASGDQTGRIIDMHTQTTVCVLSAHKSSLKQIRFQPNDDNMITTSSRDGSVMLWDMRCGGRGSVASLRTPFARNVDNGDVEPSVRYAKYTLDVGSAYRTSRNAPARMSSNESTDMGAVSITAIQHLSFGREHLLLTTSELNSSVKLWDLRNVSRRSSNALLSHVPVPGGHAKTRNYGINAMALSGDGARLYTACRDGTVYAYSTSHLATGCVPKSFADDPKGCVLKAPKSGLGPLYGFRHPSLRLGTFYVRAALRPARGDKPEMLALGSSDNCAVLFPTDERDLPAQEREADDEDVNEEQEEADLPSVPSLRTGRSNPPAWATTPVREHGTPLIRGHNKEVTSLTWSYDGDLVTVGDDFIARCWREDAEEARRLRGCGESEGQRWGCGWADMEDSWDEDDS